MRLIAFDLDGTLLDHDKTIPQKSLHVVERLRSLGCLFAVITGRATVPRDVLEGIRPDATAVNNGGLVLMGETVVAEHLLTPEQVRAVNDIAPQDADVIAFGRNVVYSRDPSRATMSWLGGREVRPMRDAFESHVGKFNIMHPDAWQYVNAMHAVDGVTVTGGVAPYEHFLTVTARDANKGRALRDIAGALGVPLANTIAFGDSDNDRAMFEVAGVAVQVGEAECLTGAAHERVSCAALGLPGRLEQLVLDLSRDLARA